MLADWVQFGIEWLVAIALFAIPALLIFGGVKTRRFGMGAGGPGRVDRNMVVPLSPERDRGLGHDHLYRRE